MARRRRCGSRAGCRIDNVRWNFNGWGITGPVYIIALVIGFAINLFVIWAYSELITMFPREGQIYEFIKQAFDRGALKKWDLRIAAGAETSYWPSLGSCSPRRLPLGRPR